MASRKPAKPQTPKKAAKAPWSTSRATPGATPRASKSDRITSTRDLATAVGVSHEAVRKWPNHAAWDLGPLPSPSRPWNAAKLEQVRRWRSQNLGEDRAAASAREARADDGEKLAQLARTSKARKEYEQARKLKLENDLREGKYVLREEIEQQLIRKIHVVKAALLGLSVEFEQRLPEDVRDDLDDRIHQILNAFADGKEAP